MDSGKTVELDPETRDRLDKLAEGRRSAPSLLIREAVEQYVDREEKRQACYADARTAWASFQDGGQHLGEIEAERWLDRLVAGADVDPPKCHD